MLKFLWSQASSRCHSTVDTFSRYLLFLCCERYKTTRLELKTNFSRGQPFGPLIIPAALRSKTVLGVGATQMTSIGVAIDFSFPSEGQVPTSNRLCKPELSMTHVCHD